MVAERAALEGKGLDHGNLSNRFPNRSTTFSGEMPTCQCFLEPGSKAIEQLQIASTVTVIASQPCSFEAPTLARKFMTLAEALDHKWALSVGDIAYNDIIYVHDRVCTLSLTANTYAKAGIEAKLCKRTGQYRAEIPLAPGSAYSRLKWAAENTLVNRFEFYVAGSTSSATSVAQPVRVPELACPSDQEGIQDWANEVSEWAGLVGMGSEMVGPSPDVDPSICNYQLDGTLDTVYVLQFQGVITSQKIRTLFDELPQWAIITANGFANCPVAWNKPHSSGGFGYTVIKTDNVHCLQYVSWGDL